MTGGARFSLLVCVQRLVDHFRFSLGSPCGSETAPQANNYDESRESLKVGQFYLRRSGGCPSFTHVLSSNDVHRRGEDAMFS